LIQRLGPVANLNIHRVCPVLLQILITRLMELLTRRGVLVEEMGQTDLAEPGDEAAAAPVRAPG
jgi:hypothetical protein